MPPSAVEPLMEMVVYGKTNEEQLRCPKYWQERKKQILSTTLGKRCPFQWGDNVKYLAHLIHTDSVQGGPEKAGAVWILFG